MSEPSVLPSTTEPRERRLIRVQAISGLVFASFLTLHLFNVMVSVFGPGLYDAFQIRVRPLYQFPLIELGVLMAALVVHIAAGIRRLRGRPRTRQWSKLPLRTRLHRLSAYFLVVVIFGHIGATRLPSVFDDVWLGFAGLSYTVTALPAVFVPYYMVLGLCGLYHGSYGTYLALRALGVRLPSISTLRGRVWVPLAVGAGLIVLGVLSFRGAFYAIDDPAHSEFARFLVERLGVGE